MTAIADECLVGSLGNMFPFQRDCASVYLRDKRVTVGRIARVVKRTFEGAIICTYRGGIQEAIEGAGGRLEEIALRLRKNKSLRSRWKAGKAVPDWETLCLAVAAFDVNIGESLPRGRQAVMEAIRKSLQVIRAEIFHEDVGFLGDGDLACLHYASLSAQWWLGQEEHNANVLLAAAERIANRVATEVPTKCIHGHEDVERAIRGWPVCWFVFHSVVPYDWQYARAGNHAIYARRPQ